MAYTMQAEGMEAVSELLNRLGEEAESAAAQGLYEGAGVMADEVRKAAEAIRTAPFKWARKGTTRLPSPEEKEIIVNAASGIAKFRKNGSEVDTSVGYARSGYANLKGHQRAVAQIANAVNSGTSFMQAQPFFRKSVRQGQQKAAEAIARKIEEQVDNLTK